tara:strand:+ start:133 stop:576 length:444 start_codon:yes stop_codon:yes gene_type:complete
MESKGHVDIGNWVKSEPNVYNPDNFNLVFIILVVVILFIIMFCKSSYEISRYSENIRNTSPINEPIVTDIENPTSRLSENLNDQIVLISNIKCLINDECPICIENFKEDDELYQLKCGHIFHTDCITEWININNVCPSCRKVVVNTS